MVKKNDEDWFGSVSYTHLILHNAVITKMPDSKLVTLNFTCKIPVMPPATAPARNDKTHAIQGSTPTDINNPVKHMPNGNEPSTVKSGKSSTL